MDYLIIVVLVDIICNEIPTFFKRKKRCFQLVWWNDFPTVHG
jgi:hypothetical protein